MELRRAGGADLELLVRVDLDDEGVTPGYRVGWGEAELEGHRRLIRSFIDDGGGLIAELDGETVGALLWRERVLGGVEVWSVFRLLDPSIFPADGGFAEIFQLWVHPDHRRCGVGTALKRGLETEVRTRGLRLIYTHTEARNTGVLAFNARLGYREVRRGTIWDDVIRVSLVKDL